MLNRLVKELGLMLMTGSVMLTPITAYADSDQVMGAVVGFPTGAILVGGLLVSMSSNKSKASKAEKYVKGFLDLKVKKDTFIRKDTTKRKLNN